MLSCVNLTAAKAIQYYAGDNYYTQEKGIEESAWAGKGAEILGLSGVVTAEAFENLLEGRSPDGTQQLVDKSSLAKKHEARAGTDMTLSAPKSVTLTSLHDPRIIDAHRKAVQVAVKEIERELSYVRLGKEKKVHNAENMTIALFHHDTSRKTELTEHPDPQLHTHCVALNMIQVDDGKDGKRWLSHYNDGVFNNSKLFGMVYQNALGLEVQRLGYEIESNGNGTFEIKGYSREQIEEFSRRRMQIVALGAKTKKQERVQMLAVRLAKGEEIPTEVLKKAWLEQIADAGIIFPEPRTDKSHKLEFQDEIAERAIDSSIRHLSERDVSFRDRSAIAFALENHIGELPSYHELTQALKEHPWVLSHSQNYFGDQNYTTPQAIQRERETVRILNEGKGKFAAITSHEQAEQVVSAKAEGMQFSKGQEDAFRLVSTTRDQIVGWQGVAGAGKSYALKDFKELSEKNGWEVIGLAPDASAAKVLGESAEIAESKTVASFLTSRTSQEDHKRPADARRKPQVWIVDEAGKMSAREMLSLLEQAVKDHAKVVLVGDTRQLSAVEAGNPFKSLQKHGMTTAHLTEHKRQKAANLKIAVNLISEGKIVEGLKAIRSEVSEFPRAATRIKQAADTYLALKPEEREKTLVLAGTNAERRQILEAIRDHMKAAGELGESTRIDALRSKDITEEAARFAGRYEIGDVIVPFVDQAKLNIKSGVQYEVISKTRSELRLVTPSGDTFTIDPALIRKKSVFVKEDYEVAVGDRLKWTKNDYTQDRRNGEDLSVVAIEGNKITLKNSKGALISVDAGRRQYLDHSRVSTAYSSQGKTADRVILVGDNTIGKESMYVAISRAKYVVKIFVDSYDRMVQRAQRSQAKRTALELFETKERKNAEKKQPKQDSEFKNISDDLKRGQAHSAFIKLRPHITELADSTERLAAVAKRYVALSADDREKTVIVAPSREEAAVLKSHVRRELHAAGLIKQPEKAVMLEPKPSPDKALPLKIEVGDILVPARGSSLTRVRKGVMYRVAHITPEGLLVKSPSNKPLLIKPDEFKGQILVERKNSIAEGDSVLSLDPTKKPVIGRVVEIAEGRVHVEFADGRSERHRIDRPIPLEHAIVQHSFKRIGEDKERVLMACDHKIGSKAMEQAVDRSVSSIEVFTDNVKKMEERFKWYQEEASKKSNPQKAVTESFAMDIEKISKEFAMQKKLKSPQIQPVLGVE